MGLVCILIATVLNTTKGYCSKRVSGKLTCFADNINLSFFRSLVCALLGGIFVAIGGALPAMSAYGWLVCIIAGASLSVNYVAWVLALRTDAYMFASASSSAGFVVAVIGGILLLGETLTIGKTAAILCILAGMWFMLRYQIEFSGMPAVKDLLLLVTVFVTQGVSQLTQKMFTQALPDISAHVYTFWSFVISAGMLLVLRLFLRYPGTKREETARLGGLLPWIAVMGSSLYGVTYFQALASTRMDAVVLYPLNNGLVLVASMLMSWLALKEKPSRNSIIGAALVFAALVLTRF